MYILQFKKEKTEASLAVQWVRLRAPSAGAWVSVPWSRGTKIPYASRNAAKRKKEKTFFVNKTPSPYGFSSEFCRTSKGKIIAI